MKVIAASGISRGQGPKNGVGPRECVWGHVWAVGGGGGGGGNFDSEPKQVVDARLGGQRDTPVLAAVITRRPIPNGREHDRYTWIIFTLSAGRTGSP